MDEWTNAINASRSKKRANEGSNVARGIQRSLSLFLLSSTAQANLCTHAESAADVDPFRDRPEVRAVSGVDGRRKGCPLRNDTNSSFFFISDIGIFLYGQNSRFQKYGGRFQNIGKHP